MPETGESLSLLAHSLDVAVVFRTLCDLDGMRRTLAKSTETLLTDEHLDRLAVLAMLHDIGKANLGFQDKILPGRPARVGHIRELAPLFIDEKLRKRFLESLPRGIETWFSSTASADSYFFAIFSHHGRPVRFLDSKSGTYWLARDKWWHHDISRDPIQAIAEISSFAEKAFPRAFLTSTSRLPDEPRFHHRFAGLVMLADWLGSHNHWFPVQRVTAEERLTCNLKVAPELLRAVGLDARPLYPALMNAGDGFESRFAEFGLSPLPLQAIVDELDPNDLSTRLVIAESETGSGKTEAALNWFCKLFLTGKVDSLYFALPTRVAARELYGRINKYVASWFPDPDCRPVTLLAVPGYAQVNGHSVKELIPNAEEANLWQDDQETLNLERHWAGARPKRFLAATIAVGTIDQALLSIVQTAHAHLRSVCLDRSLLVVDEVHASDLYMSRLLRSLLTHHLGVGGYAMLLSATLGSRALKEYIEITEPNSVLPDLPTAIKAPYPSLTLSSGQIVATASSKRTKEVHFDIRQWAFRPEEIVDQVLAPALRAGARVLVVMNTVARAVKMLRAVKASRGIDDAWLFRCKGRICPHHGRFMPEDREILDAAVSERLGKGSLPGPVLLVGTQTLEQSLDIDADLLVTDLAPSDVLLQRVGRLHRHNRMRPIGYADARCVVLVPDRPLEMALDSRGEVSGDFKRLGYGSVYEDLRSLELTYRTLKENPEIVIPDDNRFLVEKATHPEALGLLAGGRWAEHRNLIYGKGLAKEIAASTIANIFDEYFGQVEFIEAGRAVATRLGVDQLHLSLNRQVMSPFGKTLAEMVIPGHMAPDELNDGLITVEDERDGAIILRCEERRYRYSEYGLEGIS
ncbi:MAG: CRISPR-associated helicase Cas3' [Limnochordia bacterium]